jgi:hypothetical protein
VKRALRMEQIRNPERPLQNAVQCVEFLQEGFSTQAPSSYDGTSSRDIHRTFRHVDENEISSESSMACHTISVSRSLHSIMGNSVMNKTCLLVRPLSCFSVSCIEKDWENCEQQTHVTQWRAMKLQPKASSDEVDTINDDPAEQVQRYFYTLLCKKSDLLVFEFENIKDFAPLLLNSFLKFVYKLWSRFSKEKD